MAINNNKTYVPIFAEYEDLVAALEVIAPHRVRPTACDMAAQGSSVQSVCNDCSKITITVEFGHLNAVSASALPIEHSQVISEGSIASLDGRTFRVAGHRFTETSVMLQLESINNDCELGAQEARCVDEGHAER